MEMGGAIRAAALWLIMMCLASACMAAVPAGFKARFTQSALTYANTQAVNALAEALPKATIPDQSGKSGRVSYSFQNIRIEGFDKPSSSLRLLPGQGVQWSATNAGISLHADWHAKYKQGWVKVSDHGSVDISLSGVSFSLAVLIGDAQGRPQVAAGRCTSDVGKARVKFHGDIVAFLLNALKGPLEDKVRSEIKKQLCNLLTSQINTNVENRLKKIKVVTDLMNKKFQLDYRLAGNPDLQQQYMDAFFKGEISWTARPESPPFPPSALPEWAGSERMVYLWLGGYLPRSFLYAAQRNHFLQHNLTALDLPPGNRTLLNTTCSSSICVGRLIPQVAAKYPGCQVEMRLNSTRVPEISMSPGLLQTNMVGNIALYARTPRGDAPYLLTLNVSATFNMSADIKDQVLVGEITGSRFKVDVLDSAIGKLYPKAINAMVGLTMRLFIIPTMNDQASKGFPLPMTDQITFLNSSLHIQKDALMIATDMQYQMHMKL